jgi:excisionase family DNA binding protein
MTDMPNHANSTEPKMERLLTLNEVCEHLRISKWSVHQLINNRRLKTVRLGTRRLVAPEDFKDFLEALRAEGARHGW